QEPDSRQHAAEPREQRKPDDAARVQRDFLRPSHRAERGRDRDLRGHAGRRSVARAGAVRKRSDERHVARQHRAGLGRSGGASSRVSADVAAQRSPDDPVRVAFWSVAGSPARAPVYMTEGASGCDLTAALAAPVTLGPLERQAIPTGIAMALPEGYE